jgi:hypothetical protein
MWNVGLVGSGLRRVENIELFELHSAEFASSVGARRTPGAQVVDSFVTRDCGEEHRTRTPISNTGLHTIPSEVILSFAKPDSNGAYQ